MVHKKIRIPRQSAVEIMNRLGQLENAVEFIDLTKDDYEAKKNYQSLINRTEELDLKLKYIYLNITISYFEELSKTYGFTLRKYQTYNEFEKDLGSELSSKRMSADQFLDFVENEIVEDEKKIIEQRLVYEKTKENYESLMDKYSVYRKAKQLSANVAFEVIDKIEENLNKLDENMVEEGITMQSNLRSISGVINLEDSEKLKRMVFRVSRGRAIPTFFDLDAEDNYSKTPKKIFNIFFQGGVENVLKFRLLKVCDIFNCSRFNIPPPDKIQMELEDLKSDLEVKRKLIAEAESSLRTFIQLKSGSVNIYLFINSLWLLVSLNYIGIF